VKAATIVLVKRLPFSSDNVVTFVKSEILLPVVPIDQKSLPLKHERSSVGARPSAAAPVEHTSPLSYGALASVRFIARVLFGGGGRGRPRSNRRASVYPVKELLFDDLIPGLSAVRMS